VENDSGAIVGNASYGGTNTAIAAGSHGVMLVRYALTNLADPYQGANDVSSGGTVYFKNPGHNGQDTQIDFSSTPGSTDINGVAWIAAQDPTNGNAPRMPHLQASIAAPTGTMVWWKLSVINHGLHGPNGNPYRDFDSGVSSATPPLPNGTQISELTNVNEPYTNSAAGTGLSDDIDVPMPSHSADGNTVVNGWEPIPAGTPWNIYLDQDWLNAVKLGFFGGDAELSVKITTSDGNTTILPEQDFYFRIAGENPPANSTTGAAAGKNAGAGACQNYIFSVYGGPTPNWTNLTFTSGSKPPTLPTVPGSNPSAPSYWFAYAIAKEETANNGGRTWYNQFLDNGGLYNNKSNSQPAPGKEGYPNWKNDSMDTGSGGYGLFQLTYEATEPNFIMPRDWIWNWQSNVQQFLPIAQEKLQIAQRITNKVYTHHPLPAFSDPSTFATTQDASTFYFWESSVITLYNGGFGWHFSSGSGGAPGTWSYTGIPPNYYLYSVALKGIKNNP
jgi:hypothetical protein